MSPFLVTSRCISGITKVHVRNSSVKKRHETRFNVDDSETDKWTRFFFIDSGWIYISKCTDIADETENHMP